MGSETLRLWDPLVRLFHWSLAGVFVANYFFTEAGESWHVWLGYYALAWIPVRVLWGFVGTPAARWADFWPTRARLAEHLRALESGRPYHRLGHSPLGALVMILMMACMSGLGVSGFLMKEVDYFWGSDALEALHESLADVLLVLVCLHLAAASIESVRLRENLLLSMITGRRRKP
ncbi:cytochrome b561 family protein [Azotobacter vinelandii CA]|uniref:Cytochrome b561 family protein n=2 Tax=Azotobacter vinelandii TaxID=354 RepID=C1DNM8_AZOVD|nr:cytochrome b/b6 domain-containing protein [Azotobacter vinelandii]ACO77244.1 cytochrome b561 family protein [Azotobacter vinelandii DJ]AGK15433.1 cytochrome b561 family protein [Azotobacter vinelandii CA]AGK19664.1 cytochrome b561 family protein [Azotobacter vinelandii CA6]WKN22929.1 cytochrome b/b6 domain-containing protein [Azotobacter vinelandii]SFX63575.1 Cytochrome b [Azotobacter vinelandii]